MYFYVFGFLDNFRVECFVSLVSMFLKTAVISVFADGNCGIMLGPEALCFTPANRQIHCHFSGFALPAKTLIDVLRAQRAGAVLAAPHNHPQSLTLTQTCQPRCV